jgi:DNA-binding NarL/FixJ family response regulator
MTTLVVTGLIVRACVFQRKRRVNRTDNRAGPCEGQEVLTLLIVDDHASFRAVARMVLADSFRVVGEAPDAQSAIALADELDPDVVLLDVELPDGDGFDVAAALSRHGDRPAVVLTSGRSRQELAPVLDTRPALRFVEKDQLSADVLRLLARSA